MNIGDKVILHPLTKKGRERIKQYGSEGTVQDIRGNVSFSDHTGPWVLVDCAGGRWVHRNNDLNFNLHTI